MRTRTHEDRKRDRELTMEDRVRTMTAEKELLVFLDNFCNLYLYRIEGWSLPRRNHWYGRVALTTGWEIRRGTEKVQRFVRKRDAMARMKELLHEGKGGQE